MWCGPVMFHCAYRGREKCWFRNLCWPHPGLLLGLMAGIAPFTGVVQGAVNYGNLTGPDVTYTNVTETPTQLPGPSPTSLYGSPSLAGDTLQFSNTSFLSSASGGSFEFQDGKLTMGITPTASKFISLINITEGGGWAVGGTGAATAEETLIINELFITSVNGVSVNPIVVTPTVTFTNSAPESATVTQTSSGTSSSIEFASTSGFSSGSWDGDANFNVTAALATAGLTGNVTGLTLTLDDQLDATSSTNSAAFIDKKFFDVTTTPTSVPEPASFGAMITAAASFLLRRKHERNRPVAM